MRLGKLMIAMLILLMLVGCKKDAVIDSSDEKVQTVKSTETGAETEKGNETEKETEPEKKTDEENQKGQDKQDTDTQEKDLPKESSELASILEPAGRLQGSRYTNDYFGFTIVLPADWEMLHGKEQLDKINEIARQINVENNEDFIKVLATEARTNSLFNISAMKYKEGSRGGFNASVTVLGEDISAFPHIKTGKEFLENVKTAMTGTEQEFKFEDGDQHTVNGRLFDHLMVTQEVEGQTITQSYYVTIEKNCAIGVQLTSYDEESKSETNKILETLEFYRAAE